MQALEDAITDYVTTKKSVSDFCFFPFFVFVTNCALDILNGRARARKREGGERDVIECKYRTHKKKSIKQQQQQRAK